jgi:hypothetical protein
MDLRLVGFMGSHLMQGVSRVDISVTPCCYLQGFLQSHNMLSTLLQPQLCLIKSCIFQDIHSSDNGAHGRCTSEENACVPPSPVMSDSSM